MASALSPHHSAASIGSVVLPMASIDVSPAIAWQQLTSGDLSANASPVVLQRLPSRCMEASGVPSHCSPSGSAHPVVRSPTAAPLQHHNRGTVVFRVCGEQVEVPAVLRRCQHSLLATLIGSHTAVPIRRNADGEIPVTSASSAAAFRLLAHVVTSPDDVAAVFERFGGALICEGQAQAALSALRWDAEYFLGSTTNDSDFHDFTQSLQQFALRHGVSPGLFLCPSGMTWSVHRVVRPDVARLNQQPAALRTQRRAQAAEPPAGPASQDSPANGCAGQRPSAWQASAASSLRLPLLRAGSVAGQQPDASPAGPGVVLPLGSSPTALGSACVPEASPAGSGPGPGPRLACRLRAASAIAGPGPAAPPSPPLASPPHGGPNAIASAPQPGLRLSFDAPAVPPTASSGSGSLSGQLALQRFPSEPHLTAAHPAQSR